MAGIPQTWLYCLYYICIYFYMFAQAKCHDVFFCEYGCENAVSVFAVSVMYSFVLSVVLFISLCSFVVGLGLRVGNGFSKN